MKCRVRSRATSQLSENIFHATPNITQYCTESVCLSVYLFLYLCLRVSVRMCRSDCGGPCLSGEDSALSSPVAGHHFRPRDLDLTGHAPGCHDDACCVAKSLLIHDDVISTNTSTTAARSSSPQARLLYDSRPAVAASSSNSIHAVVFSSKPDQQNPIPVICDCEKIANDNEEPMWQLAQSPTRSSDDVQYYVIDRRKLASAMRLTTSSTSKRTSASTDDVKHQCRRGSRTENSGSLPAQSVVGECRPLLVVSPADCCRNQRYSPVPASVDNSNSSTS